MFLDDTTAVIDQAIFAVTVTEGTDRAIFVVTSVVSKNATSASCALVNTTVLTTNLLAITTVADILTGDGDTVDTRITTIATGGMVMASIFFGATNIDQNFLYDYYIQSKSQ